MFSLKDLAVTGGSFCNQDMKKVKSETLDVLLEMVIEEKVQNEKNTY